MSGVRGLLPAALMAVRRDEGDTMAIVCAWCEGKADAEKWCVGFGYRVSHGICPECMKVLLANERVITRLLPWGLSELAPIKEKNKKGKK